MKKSFRFAITLGLVSVAASGLSMAEDGQWKYSTGLDVSTGDYGGDPVDTDITYMPFTTAYTSGLWQFKATVPWVEIEGANTVVGAGDGGVVVDKRNQDSQPVSSTESGLGDIWLSATYSVQSIPAEQFYLDLGAKIKLPTADEDDGLGTGETDYTLQADFFKPLGAATPFLTLAYKIKGEPSGVELDNVMYVSAGSDFKLNDSMNYGLSLDFQQAASSGGDNALELFGYINSSLNDSWGLMLYGYTGLADGSPDYGAGIQISYKP